MLVRKTAIFAVRNYVAIMKVKPVRKAKRDETLIKPRLLTETDRNKDHPAADKEKSELLSLFQKYNPTLN